MAQCVTEATETLFATSVSTEFTTTSTTAISTPADVVSTGLSAVCAESGVLSALSVCLSSVTLTSTTTIHATPITLTLPVTLTVPITHTEATATLFTTSCTTSSSSISSSSSVSSSASQSSPSESQQITPPPTSPPPPPPSSGTPPSSSSPPPSNNGGASGSGAGGSTVVNVMSSTLPNGSVTVQTVTSVMSMPPSSTDSPGIQGDQTGNGGNSKNGLIVGCIIAGFCSLLFITALLWFIRKRCGKRSFKDLFGPDEDSYLARFAPGGCDHRQPIDVDDFEDTLDRKRADPPTILTSDVPKPYHYGLIGHTTSSTGAADAMSISAPTTPGSGPGTPRFEHAPPVPALPAGLASLGLMAPIGPQSGMKTPPSAFSHQYQGSQENIPLLARATSPPGHGGAAAARPFSQASSALDAMGHSRAGSAASAQSMRLPLVPRLSLALANWNVSTDGVLVDAEDTSSRKSVQGPIVGGALSASPPGQPSLAEAAAAAPAPANKRSSGGK